MPPLHARKLDLLPPSSSSSAAGVVSLLCEPFSLSLALFLSDSSALLFSSLSAFSSSPPQSPARVPPSASSAASCFARLLPSPSSAAHVVFLSATSSPAAAVLLRAWVLPPLFGRFAPATISFKRRTSSRAGLALDALPYGLGVRLAGSVNVVAIHSLAANQIWVLAAKLTEKGAEGAVLELKKTAVVEVLLPIYSIAVDMGCLVLGEVGGVRVFPLRPLIKGRSVKCSTGGRGIGLVGDVCKKKSVLNGLVVPPSNGKRCGCSVTAGRASAAGERCLCNGEVSRIECVVEGNADEYIAPRKIRTVIVKQNSGDHCSFFMAINCEKEENLKNGTGILTLLKAVSIHTLSKNKFLVLDSAGDLHVLSLHITTMTSETTDGCSITTKGAHTHHLDHTMKVQLLAVLPDISAKKQVVWVSDGGYSVHVISASDCEPPVSEDGEDDKRSTKIQISDTEAIFVREKVQDIVALSKNAVLVLGQGNVFAYGTA